MFDQRYYALRLLDMPIQFPGTALRLPDYAERFRPFVQLIHQYCLTHPVMDDLADRYAYLTVDQGLVKAETTQRMSGCHVDGFQGVRIHPKVAPDVSFITADCLPPVFYPQAWDLDGFDPAVDHAFHAFDRQADSAVIWRPAPGEIVACDAYTVHRAEIAPHDLVRTFVRLTYSVRVFDRLGNTINPCFPYDWIYVTRASQPHGIRRMPHVMPHGA